MHLGANWTEKARKNTMFFKEYLVYVFLYMEWCVMIVSHLDPVSRARYTQKLTAAFVWSSDPSIDTNNKNTENGLQKRMLHTVENWL